MRKICIITGSRSEYDILYSVMKAVDKHPQLELHLIVTGVHTSELFGNTIKEIEKDGFPISEKINSFIDAEALSSRIKSAAVQLLGLIPAIEKIKPDILIALGDREEAVTISLVGVYMNIPVAHLGGGDKVWGNVDDTVRHAVTKLAHLHFPATEENAQRIIRMGEEPWRVSCVGNAGLDRLLTVPVISREDLSKRLCFDIKKGPVILLIQHPLSSEFEEASQQIGITMEAIKELKIKTLIGYPNSDPGSKQIIDVIEEYSKRLPFVKLHKNLNRVEFVNLMRIANVLVGNSSCGITESPLLKLPVVNIGNRQKNRQHAENVIFVNHDKEEIIKAINVALYDEEFKEKVTNCLNPYGDGHTGSRVAETLARVPLGMKLINKDITY